MYLLYFQFLCGVLVGVLAGVLAGVLPGVNCGKPRLQDIGLTVMHSQNESVLVWQQSWPLGFCVVQVSLTFFLCCLTPMMFMSHVIFLSTCLFAFSKTWKRTLNIFRSIDV